MRVINDCFPFVSRALTSEKIPRICCKSVPLCCSAWLLAVVWPQTCCCKICKNEEVGKASSQQKCGRNSRDDQLHLTMDHAHFATIKHAIPRTPCLSNIFVGFSPILKINQSEACEQRSAFVAQLLTCVSNDLIFFLLAWCKIADLKQKLHFSKGSTFLKTGQLSICSMQSMCSSQSLVASRSPSSAHRATTRLHEQTLKHSNTNTLREIFETREFSWGRIVEGESQELSENVKMNNHNNSLLTRQCHCSWKQLTTRVHLTDFLWKSTVAGCAHFEMVQRIKLACHRQELLGTTIKRSTTVMRSSSDVQAPTDQLILVFLLLDLPPHPQEGLLHCVVALVFCPLLLTATMLFSSTLSFLNSHKTSFDCLTVSSTCTKWVVFFDQLTLWHWLDTSFTVFLQDRQLCESWPFFLVKLPAHLFACHMWSWHVHIDGFFRNVSLIGEQHLIFDCSNLWIFSSTGSVFPSLAWWVVNNSVLFLPCNWCCCWQCCLHCVLFWCICHCSPSTSHFVQNAKPCTIGSDIGKKEASCSNTCNWTVWCQWEHIQSFCSQMLAIVVCSCEESCHHDACRPTVPQCHCRFFWKPGWQPSVDWCQCLWSALSGMHFQTSVQMVIDKMNTTKCWCQWKMRHGQGMSEKNKIMENSKDAEDNSNHDADVFNWLLKKQVFHCWWGFQNWHNWDNHEIWFLWGKRNRKIAFHWSAVCFCMAHCNLLGSHIWFHTVKWCSRIVLMFHWLCLCTDPLQILTKLWGTPSIDSQPCNAQNIAQHRASSHGTYASRTRSQNWCSSGPWDQLVLALLFTASEEGCSGEQRTHHHRWCHSKACGMWRMCKRSVTKWLEDVLFFFLQHHTKQQRVTDL